MEDVHESDNKSFLCPYEGTRQKIITKVEFLQRDCENNEKDIKAITEKLEENHDLLLDVKKDVAIKKRLNGKRDKIIDELGIQAEENRRIAKDDDITLGDKVQVMHEQLNEIGTEIRIMKETREALEKEENKKKEELRNQKEDENIERSIKQHIQNLNWTKIIIILTIIALIVAFFGALYGYFGQNSRVAPNETILLIYSYFKIAALM